ncbi:hypothetical protein DFH28DRAFT_943616 [Melampsora americana]|nr:hypothetical protein DFH28DRAFT_943616 [Melampsora americana]
MSYLPNQSQEPLYYPVRPNSHFTSSSQHSHQHQQTAYRDEHEMTSVRNHNQTNSSNKNKKKPTQQHAFGDDSDDDDEQPALNDSDSDEDDGQGFGVYKDNPETDKRYKNNNITSNVYRDDPYSQNQNDPNRYSNSPSTTLGGTPNYLQNGGSGSFKKPMEYKKSDLVQMPALGSDWAPDEGRFDKDWEGKPQMLDKPKWTQRKHEIANVQTGFKNSIRDWLMGRKKACGWFGRIQGLVLLVILLIALALMLFFFIPRVPTLAYNNQQLMVGDNSTASFKRADPIGFSFDAKMDLAFDAKNSYLGPKVHNLVVIVQDLSAAGAIEVGRGNSDQDVISLSTKDYTPFTATVHFRYSASAITDPIWSSYYAACGHMWPGNSTRPTLNLAIGVSYKVSGISGDQFESTVLNSIGCPIELSANSA